MAQVLRHILRQSAFTHMQRTSAPNVLAITRLCTNKAGLTDNAKPKDNQVQNYDKDSLQQMVRTNKVVIFMKGNPESPRCGFSNAVVQIMHMHGVQYDAHDVLQSDALRQGIKDFTDWPTIPQVFIDGEFVGGCDILLQMHQNGDLIEEFKKVGIESLLLKQQKAKESTATTSDQSTPKTKKE